MARLLDDAISMLDWGSGEASARPRPRADGAAEAGGLRFAIRRLDAFLQRIEGIREYSSDALCVFRIALRRAGESGSATRAGLSLRPDDVILDLHLWNEHVPQVSPCGPDFSWAKRFRRRTFRSLGELAARLSSDPDLRGVKAIRIRSALAGAEDRDKMARVFAIIGFRRAPAMPSPRLSSRLSCRLNSLWASALLWTYNPHCPRRHVFSRTCDEFWISRAAFLERFGALASGAPAITPPRRSGDSA